VVIDEVVFECRLKVDELIKEDRICDGLIEHLNDFYHAVVREVLFDVVLKINLSLPQVAHETILVDNTLIHLL